MKTGVRVQKTKTAENGINHDDCKMTYDYQNNLFYSFKFSTVDTRMEAFTISNFKKGGASTGFAKEYLSKRINQFKSVIYGDD